MPSPKSGTAGSADSPVEPDKAKDAADSTPGDTSSTSANPAQVLTDKWNSVKLQTSSDSEPAGQNRTHWISIELKDDKGKPVPNQEYEVKTSDGDIVGGKLDEDGKAKVEGLPPGQCEVRFPRLHNSEWRKA